MLVRLDRDFGGGLRLRLDTGGPGRYNRRLEILKQPVFHGSPYAF
jgi:hypothetical protein